MATRKITKQKTPRRASTTPRARRRTTTPCDPRHPLHAAWVQTFEDEKNANLMRGIAEAGGRGAIWIGQGLMRGIGFVTMGVIGAFTALIVNGLSQDEDAQGGASKRIARQRSGERIVLREMGRAVPLKAQNMNSAGYDSWLEGVGEETAIRYGEVIQPTRPRSWLASKTKRNNNKRH